MKRRIVLGLMAMAVTALAAGKPDFTGTWKLDPSKSDFGQMTPPDKMERVIDHKDPAIKIKTIQSTPKGDRTTETEYTLDGKEQKQENPRGVVLYTPKWEGDVVMIDSKRNVTVAGQQVEITGFERWSLSGDGKTMTVESKMVLPSGEVSMKAVFTKQ
ncbi:MAG TPA: hypothetical protein PKJ41_05520 [Bryobacteraceae bacterium]|nr:hypothetical protein [Bryobacteraceae bacterium]HPT27565.1 hypothetical protein [Bryobacteraceae bacterium]